MIGPLRLLAAVRNGRRYLRAARYWTAVGERKAEAWTHAAAVQRADARRARDDRRQRSAERGRHRRPARLRGVR